MTTWFLIMCFMPAGMSGAPSCLAPIQVTDEEGCRRLAETYRRLVIIEQFQSSSMGYISKYECMEVRQK